MDRRRILLVVAVVVAVMGSALVFLYVRGADTRAAKKFTTVTVLKATGQINPGETIADAQSSGKLAIARVPQDQLLPGAETTTTSLEGTVALGTIYPGEQIIAAKFGAPAAVQSALQTPPGMMAQSVNLTDTGRVAGFVNPGSQVAIFVTGTLEGTGTSPQGGQQSTAVPIAQLLLPKVTVLAVGATTTVATTTTDQTGASTTEQLPKTLITLAVTQDEAQKLLYAETNGEISFTLLTDKSQVAAQGPTTASNLFG